MAHVRAFFPILGAMLLGSAGLGSSVPAVAAIESPARSVYQLGPGDKLHITVYNEPTLTGDYSVSSAGAVSFPLIGDIPALGVPIEELQSRLKQKLADGYVNDPRVSVEVLNYRPYYILGEVMKPGEYPYSVGLDLVQAVATAGGYTYRANTRKLFLRRKGQAEVRVNLKRESPPVLPGDTIRVGERYF
jgi:polysaccharide export outer membrane protein